MLQAQPYYDLYVPDSDEEYEPANSAASGMTDVEREQHPAGSALSEGGTSRLPEAAATAADADSADGAAATSAAAVQETSSKSEETAVDAGAEEGGSGAAAVAAGRASAVMAAVVEATE